VNRFPGAVEAVKIPKSKKSEKVSKSLKIPAFGQLGMSKQKAKIG
jgi:hypothetical protein